MLVSLSRVLIIFLMVTWVACGRGDQGMTMRDLSQRDSSLRDSVRITLSTEPPTLDWNRATDNVGYQIINQLMEGLTQYDEGLNTVPALAKSWEVLDGGMRYRFFLDEQYRWSDGQPVLAQHFYDSWLRLLHPETAAEYAYFLFDIVGAREFNQGKLKDPSKVGMRVIGDRVFEVTLTKPVVFFPAVTTFMVTFPIRRELIERYGEAWTDPRYMVTCGPYYLTEWWHEYRLKLSRNPQYGGRPKPRLEQLIIYLVSDPSTALSLYETGHVDVVRLPPIALDHYRAHPDRVSQSVLRGYYYGFNQRKPPFDDARVRRALAMALDKSELPAILKGGEIPTDSWIPHGMFAVDLKLGLHFDPAQARRFLQLAGYTAQNPVPLVTLAYNSDPTNKKIAEWAQAQWQKHLGVSVQLENQEWKSYLSALRHDPPGLFRLGWGADYPDPDNFMNLFSSVSGNNHTQWMRPEYDALIADAAKEVDPKRRKDLYDRAQRLLLEEDVVIIPLFVATQQLLVREGLRPFPLQPLDFVYYKRVQ